VKVDKERVKKYLYDILSNTREIENLLKDYGSDEILGNRHLLKSIKYSLVEISEAMSLVLQHILAKHYGIPVKGYIDAIKKASDAGLIDHKLVHRYWIIDDKLLLNNCKTGYKDFFAFIEAIEQFLEKA